LSLLRSPVSPFNQKALHRRMTEPKSFVNFPFPAQLTIEVLSIEKLKSTSFWSYVIDAQQYFYHTKNLYSEIQKVKRASTVRI
tara:strand:- start:836 stop:1084 length:249 start_codon:yes stop_codon:yes gene_type:complete